MSNTRSKLEGKISRYAWGKDYHLVLWEKLNILENELKEIDPDFKSLSYVDTGPVMDKVLGGKSWDWLAGKAYKCHQSRNWQLVFYIKYHNKL